MDTEYSSGTNFGVRNVPFVVPSLTLQLKDGIFFTKAQSLDWANNRLETRQWDTVYYQASSRLHLHVTTKYSLCQIQFYDHYFKMSRSSINQHKVQRHGGITMIIIISA